MKIKSSNFKDRIIVQNYEYYVSFFKLSSNPRFLFLGLCDEKVTLWNDPRFQSYGFESVAVINNGKNPGN